MNPQEWDHWLRSFLKRHPLKDPPAKLQRDYHRQVMDRILAPPVWVVRPIFKKPWTVFGWAGALAAVTAVLVLMPTPARVARQIDRDSQLFLETGELALLDSAELEQDLKEYDRIVLAEAVPQEPAREEALEIWEELESLEEIPAVDSGEDLEKELRQLDESELAIT
ncbi:MAG: hypothetical protein Q7J69_01195 [Candidatus Omnitrophota bacterium]|nr:hypothetical protein [Candidatus Omnitrophota bacterium]